MERAIEFNKENEELKKYFEDCLKDANIDYLIKVEDRWIEHYHNPSEFYQAYCIYVNSTDTEKIKQFMRDYENATIITDEIEELQNINEEENEEISEKFTFKNLLNSFWIFLIIIGIVTIIVGISIP